MVVRDVTGERAMADALTVRARQQQKKRPGSGLKALEKSVRDVASDLEKRLRR